MIKNSLKSRFEQTGHSNFFFPLCIFILVRWSIISHSDITPNRSIHLVLCLFGLIIMLRFIVKRLLWKIVCFPFIICCDIISQNIGMIVFRIWSPGWSQIIILINFVLFFLRLLPRNQRPKKVLLLLPLVPIMPLLLIVSILCLLLFLLLYLLIVAGISFCRGVFPFLCILSLPLILLISFMSLLTSVTLKSHLLVVWAWALPIAVILGLALGPTRGVLFMPFGSRSRRGGRLAA